MENLNLKFLKDKKVHFVGIGGISMSSLALILKAHKIFVQGSDEAKNAEVKKLKKRGVVVFENHAENNLKDIDVVVYSSAILDDNTELVYARKNNLILIKRAELLAMIAEAYKTVISIAGSHGKTTASAMISEMLLKTGLNPTFHIGGVLNYIHSNYRLGSKKIFVTESCEYKDNFLHLHPDVSVILNVDADHLDYFGDLNGVVKSFEKFANNTNAGGINVICADDENSKTLFNKNNTLTFGLKNADVYASSVKEYKPCYFSFNVYFAGLKLGNIKLNIIGKHNIYNALACVLVGLALKIDFADIKTSIESFSGVERRCQKITEIKGVQIYHDYAHHPEQIKKMIDVAKDLVKKSKGRVIVVFEPHTYSRTKFLIDDFAKTLSEADMVFLAPVYAAREHPTAGFDSLKLASETKKLNKQTFYIEEFEEIKSSVLKLAKPKDVVFILGAGTIERLAKMFL